MPHHDIVGKAGERLAHVSDAAADEFHARDRVVQRERALVLLGLGLVLEVYLKRAEQLVCARAPVALREYLLFGLVVAGEYRLADLRELLRTEALCRVLSGAAAPYRVLVELQEFFRFAPVHHRAKPSVAYRISLGPHFRRTVREELLPSARRFDLRRRSGTVPPAFDENPVLFPGRRIRHRDVHRLAGRERLVEELGVAALYHDPQFVLDEIDYPSLAFARHLVVEKPRRFDAVRPDRRQKREPARELRRAHFLAQVARLRHAGPQRLHRGSYTSRRGLDSLLRKNRRVYRRVQELAFQPVAAARVDAEGHRQTGVHRQGALRRQDGGEDRGGRRRELSAIHPSPLISESSPWRRAVTAARRKCGVPSRGPCRTGRANSSRSANVCDLPAGPSLL